MFMQAYIQKLKPKLRFIFTLAFAITAVFLLSKPLQTQATGAMTESDFDAKGVTTVVGGANYDRTGYLFYLSYPNGSDASDCFLQALFGKSCKVFLENVASPNWRKLQSLGWQLSCQPHSHCRPYLVVTV